MAHAPNGGIILRNNDGTAMTKTEVILLRRGAFKGLPVLCSNDLVHGSWWFFWGSVISATFSLVPLIQQYESFYHQHDDLLPAADFQVTWGLLIASGVFFALGSLAFVRAFDEPPQRPLFYNLKHLQTDELLGAWLFLLGTAPAVPYSFVFFSVQPSVTYMGMILVSLLFLGGTVLFVLGCYPSDRNIENYLLPLCIRTIGPRMWVVKHLANDWLAGTWFLLWANIFVTIISVLFFFVACAVGNSEAIFIWLSGSLVSYFFCVGSVYFVAGSYPHASQFYYVHDHGNKPAKGLVDGSLLAAENGTANSSLGRKTGSGLKLHEMEYRHLDAVDTVNPIHQSGSATDIAGAAIGAPAATTGSAAAVAAPAPGGDHKDKKKKPKKTKAEVPGRKPDMLAVTTNLLPALHVPVVDDEDDNRDDDDDEL